MKNILIVDDDNAFRLSLTDGLRAHDATFNVMPAANGKEATEILKKDPVDLVVTDIKMPEMSGFELLTFMSQHFKDIPAIVITAFGTPDMEKEVKSMGTVQYLEKPLDFNILVEKIYKGLDVKKNGYIKGISLPSILQVIEMEKESCILTIKSKGKQGYLFFENGRLMDADTNDKNGTDAAYDIVTWEETEIEIDKKPPARTKAIDEPLNFIIIEGHRRKDEHLNEALSKNENQNIKIDSIKENSMNIQRLNEAIKILQEDLGEGLLAADIWTISDGQSVAGLNSQPKACALFNGMTEHMNKALSGAGFPILGKYYILDLADKKMAIIIPLDDYQWGMLVDGTKVKLGLLLNIAIPKVIDAFEEALTS